MDSTTLPSYPATASTAVNRRSYSCYNCNHSFFIRHTPTTTPTARSCFRCPSCHHRHHLPHHSVTVLPPLSQPVPTPPPYTSFGPFLGHTGDMFYDAEEFDDYEDEGESPRPASRAFVDSLPVKHILQTPSSSLQPCSICMEDFMTGAENAGDARSIINELPCRHYFHMQCIRQWLGANNTCPLCRDKLPLFTVADIEAVLQARPVLASRWWHRVDRDRSVFGVDLALGYGGPVIARLILEPSPFPASRAASWFSTGGVGVHDASSSGTVDQVAHSSGGGGRSRSGA